MTSPYPYTADISVVTQILVDKILANKDNFIIPVQGVLYGDQERIPATPFVCAEPNSRARQLRGAPNMTENTFEIFIIVYHNKVQDNSTTRKETDQLAYDIEHFLHQDLQLHDSTGTAQMIHGFVSNHESGFTLKQGTLYRSARLTYSGLNKTSLPAH